MLTDNFIGVYCRLEKRFRKIASAWLGARLIPVRPTFLVMALAAPALTACSSIGDLPVLPDASDTVYRLGPGDEIRLITVGSETLSGNFHVNDVGDISVPLVGRVHAADLSTDQLELRLRSAMIKGQISPNPSVAIEVLSYRPITVLGEVKQPGRYPYQPGITLLDAVGLAQGFTYRSDTDYARVDRIAKNHVITGRVSPYGRIEPGDVITISERPF